MTITIKCAKCDGARKTERGGTSGRLYPCPGCNGAGSIGIDNPFFASSADRLRLLAECCIAAHDAGQLRAIFRALATLSWEDRHAPDVFRRPEFAPFMTRDGLPEQDLFYTLRDFARAYLESDLECPACEGPIVPADAVTLDGGSHGELVFCDARCVRAWKGAA